jgi:hypothetical protein
MTIIEAWNEATWRERIIFLAALCKKDPDLVRRILDQSVKNAESVT